jgi:hypothetical protein
VAFKEVRFFFTGILLPFVGGVVLLAVGVKVIAVAGWSGGYADIITLALGVPLVILARLTTKGDFFKQKPVVYTEIGE